MPAPTADRWDRTARPSTEPPPVGQGPLVTAALAIGLLLMAGQLWLLTVALDRYLAGQGGEVWRLAVVSGLIFLGGLGMLWLLHRRPRIHGTTAQ
ncbi:MAG TPA: DUF6755 family protein [Chloroflexota bacterium]|nr:DUF6755 family protein [Chloroflexota bacterium]